LRPAGARETPVRVHLGKTSVKSGQRHACSTSPGGIRSNRGQGGAAVPAARRRAFACPYLGSPSLRRSQRRDPRVARSPGWSANGVAGCFPTTSRRASRPDRRNSFDHRRAEGRTDA
jgi:hypothetical protein